MDVKAKTLAKRVERWSGFFKKYEVRGKLNTADCSFPEVNYKHFVKPKIKKRTSRKRKRKINHNSNDSNITDENFNKTAIVNLERIDISDIIDEDTHEALMKNTRKPEIIVDNNIENWNTDESTPLYINSKEIDDYKHKTNVYGKSDKNSLEDLIHFIEVDLNSNLKQMLTNRSESKILEADDYSYWHECTKEEMRRLQKYITKTELKECIKYYNKEADIHVLNDIIVNQMKSNIKELLVKREFVRSNKDKYLKYCQKICDEWQKLLKVLNIHWMVFYASGIINSIKVKKVRMLSSTQYEESINSKLDGLDNSLDCDESTPLAY